MSADAMGAPAEPRQQYLAAGEPLPADLLGALVYGRDARARCAGDARLVPVPFDVLEGSATIEAWCAPGEVSSGEHGGVRWRAAGGLLFAWLELDEASHGGPRGAGREAYRRLLALQERVPHAHVLRVWNFLDAINEGEGDDERYRRFCQGRAEGIGENWPELPAASALGRRDGERILQVIWLAALEPGRTIENPRQVPAFRYPRRYGPLPPSFARAMGLPRQLLISGTASIVGHESRHDGDIVAQACESVSNMVAVSWNAGIRPVRLEGIKAYVRHAADAPAVAAAIAARPEASPVRCLLHADVCRSELLVELEAIGAPGAGPAGRE